MSDIVAVLSWWVLVQVLGLVGLPVALRLFRRLPDRGYGASKALGLLLVSYLFWLLGILGFLRNDSGSMLFVLVVVAGASLLFYHSRSLHASSFSFSAWLRANWKLVLITETVFALSFGGWALYRAQVPNIMTAGGEKFMELAFLNSLQRSETLPPHDPWLSGFAISYYYFGYLMMSILIRLTGVTPEVGFNIGGALLFALTVTGAFSLAFNLVASGKWQGASSKWQVASGKWQVGSGEWRRVWVVMALLGMVFVVFLSNFEGPLEVAHWKGVGSTSFWEWLDIAELDRSPPTHEHDPAAAKRYTRSGWWWWRASRVIFDYDLPDWPRRFDQEAIPPPHRRENIDEFPFFSFLLGDMHPHVLALSFIMLTLTASLALLHRGAEESWARWELGLLALIFGALGFLNTWDLPIQWAIAVAVYAWSRLTCPRGEFAPEGGARFQRRPIFILAVVLSVGSLLLYTPFYIGFQSQAGGVLPHVHSSTRLTHFGIMFGPLLFILIAFLAWGIVRAKRREALMLRPGLWSGAILLFLVVAVLLLTALVIWVSPDLRERVAPGMADEPGLSVALRYLGMRLSVPWVTLLLVGMIGAAVVLLASGLQVGPSSSAPSRPPLFSRPAQFSLFLIIAGALMTLAPEYVYLKDVFGVRINTIFKFYFQAWVLWAVAAAGAVYTMLVARGSRLGAGARGLFGGSLALVIGLGLIYPFLSISDRIEEHSESPTLDGTAYFATAQSADYAAVQWLNEHVEGTPVILEKPTPGSYDYEGRVSAQTGLPTLVGWGFHEEQWRGNRIEQDKRIPIIQDLYATTDPLRALTLLYEYDITYVYVGSLERDAYPADGLRKFDRLMEIVYDRDGVTIYKRRETPGGHSGE